ncbi:MAG: response regulator, partial [Candidatus Methanoperedens sp.]|nr:response regulator [Candidatus Methanoperedens sp.]
MNKPKILVVGEDSLGVELIEEILSKDYEVETAHDVEETALKVEKTVPDLIILDKINSIMSSFGVCTLLKSNEKTRYIPIMVAADNDDKKRAMEEGANGFLGKPIGLYELRAKVKSLLNASG